jgi:tRNA U54 and U55 pseudouridine synthase Pus10
MATNGKAQTLETFVKQQLGGAQKRLAGLEQEANKVLRTLKTRSKGPAREVEKFLGKVNTEAEALLDGAKVKELGRKATQVGTEVRKRLDGLQTKAVEAVGVASQAQVKELNRELSRLSKKLDQILPPAVKKAAPRTSSRVSAS